MKIYSDPKTMKIYNFMTFLCITSSIFNSFCPITDYHGDLEKWQYYKIKKFSFLL